MTHSATKHKQNEVNMSFKKLLGILLEVFIVTLIVGLMFYIPGQYIKTKNLDAQRRTALANQSIIVFKKIDADLIYYYRQPLDNWIIAGAEFSDVPEWGRFSAEILPISESGWRAEYKFEDGVGIITTMDRWGNLVVVNEDGDQFKAVPLGLGEQVFPFPENIYQVRGKGDL